MQPRKTPHADIEQKRGTLRSVGFTAALAIILAALAWTSYDVNIIKAIDFAGDLLEDEVIPVKAPRGKRFGEGRIRAGGRKALALYLLDRVGLIPVSDGRAEEGVPCEPDRQGQRREQEGWQEPQRCPAEDPVD